MRCCATSGPGLAPRKGSRSGGLASLSTLRTVPRDEQSASAAAARPGALQGLLLSGTTPSPCTAIATAPLCAIVSHGQYERQRRPQRVA